MLKVAVMGKYAIKDTLTKHSNQASARDVSSGLQVKCHSYVNTYNKMNRLEGLRERRAGRH